MLHGVLLRIGHDLPQVQVASLIVTDATMVDMPAHEAACIMLCVYSIAM